MELTARMKCFLGTLEMIWTKYPDWTFGELIENTVGTDFVSLDDENAYNRILACLMYSYPPENNGKAYFKKLEKERKDFLNRGDFESVYVRDQFISVLKQCYPECSE